MGIELSTGAKSFKVGVELYSMVCIESIIKLLKIVFIHHKKITKYIISYFKIVDLSDDCPF